MFLVDIQFTDPQQITAELTEAHKAYLAAQYQTNQLMFGGRKVPRTGGILLALHQQKSELVAMLEADPFMQSGAATYSITEFVPVMAAAGFAHVLDLKPQS